MHDLRIVVVIKLPSKSAFWIKESDLLNSTEWLRRFLLADTGSVLLIGIFSPCFDWIESFGREHLIHLVSLIQLSHASCLGPVRKPTTVVEAFEPI